MRRLRLHSPGLRGTMSAQKCGPVFGASGKECGSCRSLSLSAAQLEAARYRKKLLEKGRGRYAYEV